jgi:hypothetical protein
MNVLFLTICQRGKNRPNPTRRINNWDYHLQRTHRAYGDRFDTD